VPRANLSREVVLNEAADLADAIGYDQLTMAALARRFGVAVPSLYKHVPSLSAVQSALACRAVRELTAAISAAVAGQGRAAALRGVATAYRQYASRHPGVYAAIVRAPSPDDVELLTLSGRLLDVVYGVLRTYGRTGEDAVHDVRALRAALHGFVSLERAGGFGMPVNVERSFGRLVDLFDAALTGGAGG
jgi:AcrR family transcriptional regulator